MMTLLFCKQQPPSLTEGICNLHLVRTWVVCDLRDADVEGRSLGFSRGVWWVWWEHAACVFIFLAVVLRVIL